MVGRGSSSRILGWLALGLGTALVLGCGDDDGDNGTQPPPGATYGDVNPTLLADCEGCHAGGGRIFRTSMDSAELVNQGPAHEHRAARHGGAPEQGGHPGVRGR
jgi:hypothetical protein